MNPAKFPDLQRYAGQKVDTGPKAKAYANGFIGRHLQAVAGGQTYSQLSTAAQADPTNAKLTALGAITKESSSGGRASDDLHGQGS